MAHYYISTTTAFLSAGSSAVLSQGPSVSRACFRDNPPTQAPNLSHPGVLSRNMQNTDTLLDRESLVACSVARLLLEVLLLNNRDRGGVILMWAPSLRAGLEDESHLNCNTPRQDRCLSIFGTSLVMKGGLRKDLRPYSNEFVGATHLKPNGLGPEPRVRT